MNIEKRNRTIAWVLLALSICAMATFGCRLLEIRQTYQEGVQSYEQLANNVRPDGPNMHINYAALREVSPGAAAWLYCPDTAIDYPVMKATDYDYYLHHLPDGTYNANGSLFIDYNNAPDFSDNLTVIYGHNMKSGQMFRALEGYKKQSYFEEHPYMYLYTASGNYRIDIMSGCVVDTGEWRDRAFMFDMNLDALLAYAAHNTTFDSKTQYTNGDKVIALSTCSYEFDSARYVVIGILRPM